MAINRHNWERLQGYMDHWSKMSDEERKKAISDSARSLLHSHVALDQAGMPISLAMPDDGLPRIVFGDVQ